MNKKGNGATHSALSTHFSHLPTPINVTIAVAYLTFTTSSHMNKEALMLIPVDKLPTICQVSKSNNATNIQNIPSMG